MVHWNECLLELKFIALAKAEAIYMAEGPISTTSFDVKSGEPGCETETLQFEESENAKTWPSWEGMKHETFAVVFDFPGIFDLEETKLEFPIK